MADEHNLPPGIRKKLKDVAENVEDILGTMKSIHGEKYVSLVVQMARSAQNMALLADLRDHCYSHCENKTPPPCLAAEFNLFAQVLTNSMVESVATLARLMEATGDQLVSAQKDADTLFQRTTSIKV